MSVMLETKNLGISFGGLKAVDVAGAAALEAGLFRKLADEGHGIVLRQGQQAALVLQKHEAL